MSDVDLPEEHSSDMIRILDDKCQRKLLLNYLTNYACVTITWIAQVSKTLPANKPGAEWEATMCNKAEADFQVCLDTIYFILIPV